MVQCVCVYNAESNLSIHMAIHFVNNQTSHMSDLSQLSDKTSDVSCFVLLLPPVTVVVS